MRDNPAQVDDGGPLNRSRTGSIRVRCIWNQTAHPHTDPGVAQATCGQKATNVGEKTLDQSNHAPICESGAVCRSSLTTISHPPEERDDIPHVLSVLSSAPGFILDYFRPTASKINS
jgi:hypothetical protein